MQKIFAVNLLLSTLMRDIQNLVIFDAVTRKS